MVPSPPSLPSRDSIWKRQPSRTSSLPSAQTRPLVHLKEREDHKVDDHSCSMKSLFSFVFSASSVVEFLFLK